MKKFINYFSKTEKLLWLFSSLFIIVSFIIFDRKNYLTLSSSLVGVSSLIFVAKGNPIGQVMMIFFSLIYGIISYNYSYYGEMITYLGMSMPMAIFSLVSWLRNPFNGNKAEVTINRISKKECCFLFLLASAVTAAFYFILRFFNTANLIPSTVSITTSFVAVYLTLRRNPYYAFWYALNDIVLIVLWVLATFDNISYISVVVCFVVFLANDLYGFYNWLKMEKRQKKLQTDQFK